MKQIKIIIYRAPETENRLAKEINKFLDVLYQFIFYFLIEDLAKSECCRALPSQCNSADSASQSTRIWISHCHPQLKCPEDFKRNDINFLQKTTHKGSYDHAILGNYKLTQWHCMTQLLESLNAKTLTNSYEGEDVEQWILHWILFTKWNWHRLIGDTLATRYRIIYTCTL